MEKSVGYLELIRKNRNFRNLWFGQIVSLLGDWFNLIASASLIGLLTQSGIAVGALFVVRMLAPFIISPIAGVFSDRYNRKKLLIIADLSRAVVVLGFLLVRKPEQVWLLYFLTAVQLAISGFFYPARSSILPDVVTEKELGAANALGSATWSIMLSVGAAMGGIVAGKWGIYPSFIIDSVTFLISAVFIAQIVYDQPRRIDVGEGTIAAGFKEYIEGLKYLIENRGILVVALLKAASSLATGAFQVIQVHLAEQVYIMGQGGSTGLGLMYAAVGAGTGFGPIWARLFTGDDGKKLRIAISISYILSGIGLAMAAPLPGFALVLVGTFLRGLGGGVNWVFSTQLLLQTVPNRVLGRVFSTEFAMMTLTSAIAAYIGGWGLDKPEFGISNIIWGMVLLALIFGTLWTIWMVSNNTPKENASFE
jgi:MFS family permease